MVIVVGKGPAGISAAIYIKRANIPVTVIGKDEGALSKAHKIDNYYGFPNGTDGKELIKSGIQQFENLGGSIVNDQIVSITFGDKGFIVKTPSAQFDADAVILATGTSRNTPNIKNLKQLEGKGVSYCAVCDGFFYKGKDICVLGNAEYALSEAKELLPIVNNATIITNGTDATVEFPENIKVIDKKIQNIDGETNVTGVTFEDGSSINTSGIFVAVGTASTVDLAKKLGVVTEGTALKVNSDMSTNVPGIYGAGDCTGGLLQVAKAVSDGAIAAASVIKFLRK